MAFRIPSNSNDSVIVWFCDCISCSVFWRLKDTVRKLGRNIEISQQSRGKQIISSSQQNISVEVQALTAVRISVWTGISQMVFVSLVLHHTCAPNDLGFGEPWRRCSVSQPSMKYATVRAVEFSHGLGFCISTFHSQFSHSPLPGQESGSIFCAALKLHLGWLASSSFFFLHTRNWKPHSPLWGCPENVEDNSCICL